MNNLQLSLWWRMNCIPDLGMVKFKWSIWLVDELSLYHVCFLDILSQCWTITMQNVSYSATVVMFFIRLISIDCLLVSLKYSWLLKVYDVSFSPLQAY